MSMSLDDAQHAAKSCLRAGSDLASSLIGRDGLDLYDRSDQ